MGSIFQFDAQILESFSVFLAMGCLCLFFSSYFFVKRRSVRKLPKNLKVNVFDKTFSVFDISSKKKVIQGFGYFLLLSPLVAFTGTFFFVFIVILNFIGAGLVLGLVLLIFSLGVLMIEEASEIRGSCNTFITAVKEGKGLGAGDFAIMSLVDDASRRLIVYYLLLGGIFFATFLWAPLVFPVALTMFVRLVDLIVGVSNTTQLFAPIMTALLFALAAVGLFIAARRLKARILGFPSANSLLSAFSASIRTRILYEKLGDALEAKPEEETW